jgi:hypothetical protein
MLLKLVYKTEWEGTLTNLFYETSITLTSKLDMDMTKQTKITDKFSWLT